MNLTNPSYKANKMIAAIARITPIILVIVTCSPKTNNPKTTTTQKLIANIGNTIDAGPRLKAV